MRNRYINNDKGIIIRIAIIYILLITVWVIVSNLVRMTPNLGFISVGILQVVFGALFIIIISVLNYLFVFQGIFKFKVLEDKLYKNEETYKYVINNTTLGLWYYNLEERECTFPEGWGSHFGYDRNEVMDSIEGWKTIVHPDDILMIKSNFRQYVKREIKKFEVEYRLRKKGGDWAWVTAYGTGIWDNNGKLLSMLVTHIDTTIKKNAEREIKESEEKFRTLFNSAKDAITLMELDDTNMISRMIEANERLVSVYGYSREELCEIPPYSLVAESEIDRINKHIEDILQGKNEKFETISVTKAGKFIPVEMNDHLFYLNGKKVLISIVRDITERKENEAKLKKMIKENRILLHKAIENEKIKTEFFCNISHEFRTPLNIILGIIQLHEYSRERMRGCSENCDYQKYNMVLKQNCYRLIRLVNNLLEINKIDANYMDMDINNYDIVRIVEDITQSVAEYVSNKGMNLIFDTDVEEKIIACDAYKIERIILNLLSNSIKYSKPRMNIFVNIYDNHDHVMITVKDTGIGIPKDKIKTIFDRFTQVDSSLTRKCEGSGIGLSIVKSFVKMHGGDIWAESQVGKGTQMFVKLPARTVSVGEIKGPIKDDTGIIEKINIEFSDIYSA